LFAVVTGFFRSKGRASPASARIYHMKNELAGLNVWKGELTEPSVAAAQGSPFVDPAEAIKA